MSMQSKSKSKIHIATSSQYPQGNADLRDLLDSLRRMGVECDFLVWGERGVCRGDLLLPLAVRDYSSNPTNFLAWLKDLEESGVKILNPLATIQKNINKRYLLDLQERGIPIIPSEFIEYDNLKKQGFERKGA